MRSSVPIANLATDSFEECRHVPFQFTLLSRQSAGKPVELRHRRSFRRSPQCRHPQRHANAAAGGPAHRAGDRQFELPDRAEARQSRQRRAIDGAASELGRLRSHPGDRPDAQRHGQGRAGLHRQGRRARPRHRRHDLLCRSRRAGRGRELSASGRCKNLVAVRSRRQFAAAGRPDGHAGLHPKPDAHRRARRLPQQSVPARSTTPGGALPSSMRRTARSSVTRPRRAWKRRMATATTARIRPRS